MTDSAREGARRRILVVHNRYQEPGGEDAVFDLEVALLRDAGHHVVEYVDDNRRLTEVGSVRAATRAIWSAETYSRLTRLIERERPDVAHMHNTFALVSPSAHHACRRAGLPVIQRLPNYRLVCPAATLFRDGEVCGACVGRIVPWPGVMHACYRESYRASAAVALLLAAHRVLRTWTRCVDVFVTPSRFAQQKIIEAGFSAERIVVKPNFVAPDPGPGTGAGKFVLFVGRLAPEKGVETLLSAWRQIETSARLLIVGEGILGPRLREMSLNVPRIEWLGRRSRAEIYKLMRDAMIVIAPSVWYETFGRVAVEAFACGTPVIAADIGGLSEIVEHCRTGRLFRPQDVGDLQAQIEWCLHHPKQVGEMRRRARAEFEARYTAQANYEMLMSIYERAVKAKSHPRGCSALGLRMPKM